MAGRSKKSMFDDIKEIETPKEPEVKVAKVKKEEVKVAKEPEVEKVPEPSNDNMATVNLKSDSDWLNVRSGPSTNDAIIGTLHNGDKVTIYESKKNWGKISEIEEKWVLLDFVI